MELPEGPVQADSSRLHLKLGVGSASIPAHVTVRGGLIWQAGAVAGNDMVRKTQSQLATDALEGQLVHIKSPSDTWGGTENRIPCLGEAGNDVR